MENSSEHESFFMSNTETSCPLQKLSCSLFFLVIFFLAGFFLINQPSKNLSPENIKYVKIAGVIIKVDLALTAAERQKGLGGRDELKENEGMLFVFDQPGRYYFWMKGMNFPIDMIWVGEDMKVIYVKKDAQPDNFLETYGPGQDVPTESRGSSMAKAIGTKYVLEVAAGFSDKNNLKVGDSVLFTY